jgi:hypothetical protein
VNKILVLKNDRVGDLANALKGINSLLNENRDKEIEIVLSRISKDLSFLFKIKNVKITYLNYSLNIFDKVKLFFKVFTSNFEKIYILAPKNIYFFLPLICKAKIFAITITNKNKSRPIKFLRSKLYYFKNNNRENRKVGESISNLINDLCNKEKKTYPNILNNNPSLSLLLNENMSLISNFIHIHYKENIFSKNGWTSDDFIDLLNSFKDLNYKIIFTSDLGNFSYHNKFLSKFSNLNFDNKVSNLNVKSRIHYFHNINTQDLFKLIDLSNVVIAPHGAMSVLASYLNKSVIDIFDTNVKSNSFHEFKPQNFNYKFLILTNDKNKVKNKILNYLNEIKF